MSAPVHSVRDLSRIFRVQHAGAKVDLHAVAGISLDLFQGRSLVIVGEIGLRQDDVEPHVA